MNSFNGSLIKVAEDCIEAGLGFDAAARLFVAGMSGNWEAWLRIVELVEKGTAPKKEEVSLFFRDIYYRALESASTGGDKEATRRMIGAYEFGRRGFPANPSRALSLLFQLADEGNSSAQFELFEKFLYGLCDLVPDKERAMHWLSLSANNGNPEAIDWTDRFKQWDESGFQYPKLKDRRVGFMPTE